MECESVDGIGWQDASMLLSMLAAFGRMQTTKTCFKECTATRNKEVLARCIDSWFTSACEDGQLVRPESWCVHDHDKSGAYAEKPCGFSAVTYRTVRVDLIVPVAGCVPHHPIEYAANADTDKLYSGQASGVVAYANKRTMCRIQSEYIRRFPFSKGLLNACTLLSVADESRGLSRQAAWLTNAASTTNATNATNAMGRVELIGRASMPLLVNITGNPSGGRPLSSPSLMPAANGFVVPRQSLSLRGPCRVLSPRKPCGIPGVYVSGVHDPRVHLTSTATFEARASRVHTSVVHDQILSEAALEVVDVLIFSHMRRWYNPAVMQYCAMRHQELSARKRGRSQTHTTNDGRPRKKAKHVLENESLLATSTHGTNTHKPRDSCSSVRTRRCVAPGALERGKLFSHSRGVNSVNPFLDEDSTDLHASAGVASDDRAGCYAELECTGPWTGGATMPSYRLSDKHDLACYVDVDIHVLVSGIPSVGRRRTSFPPAARVLGNMPLQPFTGVCINTNKNQACTHTLPRVLSFSGPPCFTCDSKAASFRRAKQFEHKRKLNSKTTRLHQFQLSQLFPDIMPWSYEWLRAHNRCSSTPGRRRDRAVYPLPENLSVEAHKENPTKRCHFTPGTRRRTSVVCVSRLSTLLGDFGLASRQLCIKLSEYIPKSDLVLFVKNTVRMWGVMNKHAPAFVCDHQYTFDYHVLVSLYHAVYGVFVHDPVPGPSKTSCFEHNTCLRYGPEVPMWARADIAPLDTPCRFHWGHSACTMYHAKKVAGGTCHPTENRHEPQAIHRNQSSSSSDGVHGPPRHTYITQFVQLVSPIPLLSGCLPYAYHLDQFRFSLAVTGDTHALYCAMLWHMYTLDFTVYGFERREIDVRTIPSHAVILSDQTVPLVPVGASGCDVK